jgi:L-threonylcarbamoyladenylate synthase
VPSPTPSQIEAAAQSLRSGELVAFPTETVYGLGANALDPRAVARIFDLKGRPRFDPLIVHVADEGQLARVADQLPERAVALAACFWPGPLTLVLPKAAAIPDIVTAELPTVAVRMPAHPVALALLRAAGVPIAAPSANRFGRISPTTAQHVRDSFGSQTPRLLDAGPSPVGVESTVIAVEPSGVYLLRPGGVPAEEIQCVLGEPLRRADELPAGHQPGAAHPASEGASVPSPGMLQSHYAPHIALTLLSDPGVRTVRAPREGRWGLLCLQRPPTVEGFAEVEVLSSKGDMCEGAANLFAALRRLDGHDLTGIVAIPVEPTGLGLAIMDRLQRAATRDANL